MGRRERQLDPSGGPIQRFADELRSLRDSAGRPTYRELAKRAHYSVTALSEAAGGEVLPSLAVTLAYVRACGGDPAEWEERWLAVAAESGAAAESTAEAHSPYLGLTTFEPCHAGLFFGRGQVVEDLCDRVAGAPFTAVFGASGSGKSSALRAGLLAAVWKGEIPGSQSWPAILMTPGARPMDALAVQLANLLAMPAGSVRSDLANTRLLIDQILAARVEPGCVLLVVDQFEEIFTLCQDEAERAAFIECLLAAGDRARVVLGVRADFFARCAQYPELVTALRNNQVLIGPMAADDLRAVVRQPAARADVKVEAALVEAICTDAHGEPGALPLISHALFETWKHRAGDAMTLAAYRRAGGVQGAVAQTAERVFAEFDAEGQACAKDAFLRLTALGQGTEDTRRRVDRAELPGGQTEEVLARLAAARLVIMNEDTVEVAHEALIRSWPRLRAWLAEDREHLFAHRRLTDSAAEWQRLGRDKAILYRGAQLAGWEDRRLDGLNDLERQFLRAGREQVAAERRAARRRTRQMFVGLVTVAAVFAVLAVIALDQADRADAGQRLALTRQLAANARAQSQLDPELALLLAKRAYETQATPETEAVLRQATEDSRIRFTVSGHAQMISGVAYHPDGTRLATSGRDGAIQVWRREPSGTLHDPVVLKAHEGDLWSPVFSQDGKRIAAGGQDGFVTVWDWATGRLLMKLAGHVGRVWSVAFSADGQRVASVGDDYTVRIWHTNGAGSLETVLTGHEERTLGVSFSSDGRWLATSSGDRTVRIWDLTGAQQPVVLRGHQNSVEVVAFHPDNVHLATASTDGTVRIWDRTKPAESVVLGTHDGTAEGVFYSRDGSRVLSTGNDGTVRIWDPNRLSRPLILRGHRGTVNAAAFSPDGKEVATAGEDGTARIWDATQTGGDDVLRGHEGEPWSAVIGPDGRIVSSGADKTVRVWGPAGPIVLRGHEKDVYSVAANPTGAQLASASGDGTVRLWDIKTMREQAVLRGHGKTVWTVSYSADGSKVASASSDGTVRVWDTSGKAGSVVLRGGEKAIRWAAISSDGTKVAGAGTDGTVRLWNSSGGDPLLLNGHQGPVWTVAFSQDGRYIASGGNDGTVRLWPVDGKSAPRILNGHQGIVWNVSFGPDGNMLASTGNDGTVRLWRTTGDSDPIVIQGFGTIVETVSFTSADRLVTTHDDGTVRTWRCEVCGPIDEVLKLADKRLTRAMTAEERRIHLNEPS